VFILQLSYSKTIVEIDSTKKYQTIDGWEAIANAMEATTVRDTLMPHIDKLIDIAVNEVGITRLRYSLKSGIEDSVDYFSKVLSGEITYDDFKLHRYSKINDNDDPLLANSDGFQMSGLDHNIKNLILPFKNAVESNGDRFYYNICFVDFEDRSEFHHTDNPQEYAELVNYVWSYIDNKYNFQPDGLEVILEPDNADVWQQSILPGIISETGKRLQENGYKPEIIAPSVMSIYNFPKYFEAIKNHPDALKYLDVLSYHRYSGNTDTIAQKVIVESARKYNLKTAMLEYDKNSDIAELHYDLKYNSVVAWTKYALMYKSDEKFAYVYVNARDSANINYGIGKQTKYLKHYFKYIRPGAVRINANPYNGSINPVAFVNKDETYVVVIKADNADSIEIKGLKPGLYGIKYTLGNYEWGGVNPKVYDKSIDNVHIENSESISFYMPDMGVASVYGINDTISGIRLNNTNIQIYPNPVSDISNIVSDNLITKIEIFNLKGIKVFSKRINHNHTSINLSDLLSGIYYMNIYKGNQYLTKKIIKI
jgi:hypothetical protein